MNEQPERKWYVYYRQAEDGLHEFTVATFPRPVHISSEWEVLESLTPLTFKEAQGEASYQFKRMNDPTRVTQKKNSNEDEMGEIEGIIFKANYQIINLLNFGFDWDDSLDAVDALNEGNNYVQALTTALRDVPDGSQEGAALAIQEFLRLVHKVE